MVDSGRISDEAIILAAYLKWGLGCTDYLLGDWAFALWDEARGRLVLARDGSGMSGMYWCHSGNTVIFATQIQAILAHPRVSRQPDPVFIASVLTVFRDPANADCTAFSGVRRLLPGYQLIADRTGIRVTRWWHPERLRPLKLSSQQDYYDAFLALYSDAVRRCISSDAGIGAALSGGLDSGSAVVLASQILGRQGRRLRAYVHRPNHEHGGNERKISDEYELARLTAEHAGNVELCPLQSADVSIIQALRTALRIHGAPIHGAMNQFWIVDLLSHAKVAGTKVLLTGQAGNATVSFSGTGSLLKLIQAGRFFKVMRELSRDEAGLYRSVRHRIGRPLLTPVRRWLGLAEAKSSASPWSTYSAIGRNLADQVNLQSRMIDAGHDPFLRHALFGATQMRAFRLAEARGQWSGHLWMEKGLHFGLDIRDPTADRRIVEFCWQVPDEVFWANGKQRGLIREGMRGYLPAAVLENSRRGLQSADIALRISAQRDEIRATMTEIESHPLCRNWLDIQRMKKLLDDIIREPLGIEQHQSSAILLRAISTGLFLAKF
jgi:asparagine synthase (glutamine-hydrolysing)